MFTFRDLEYVGGSLLTTLVPLEETYFISSDCEQAARCSNSLCFGDDPTSKEFEKIVDLFEQDFICSFAFLLNGPFILMFGNCCGGGRGVVGNLIKHD